jgi:riboflavin kinase/FMN adenylyltransferase
MEVVFGPEHRAPSTRGSAVTIGAYDGVHLGHRHLIEDLERRARGRDLTTVVVTFDRHPATVVRPQSAPLLLTDLDQKLELLASTGVEEVVVIAFDEVKANETAEEFVNEVLVRALNARLVVVGEDFHFGHGRKGNVALLSEMGAKEGFEVVGMGLEADALGEVVSSTRVRSALAGGDVRLAARLLGRHHQVRGTVVHGEGRGGAQLGFPTANIDVPPGIALAREGIYACWYERPGGQLHKAAVSLGYRPTFSNDGGAPQPHAAPVLEAFLLDFEGNLYGEAARVSFVERLRDEERFESVADLVGAMEKDVARSREVLAEGPGASTSGSGRGRAPKS